MKLKRFTIHRPTDINGNPSIPIHVIGDDMKQKFLNQKIEIYFKGERVGLAPVDSIVVATIIKEEQV